ncbi:hypothetical protein ACYPKM_01895 [Pseudomonas aeruginosa]
MSAFSSDEVAKIAASLKVGSLNNSYILIDDGNYLVEHNSKYELSSGGGVMLKRSVDAGGRPSVLKHCGSYTQQPDGSWISSLAREKGNEFLGRYSDRFDAIANLWSSRHLL